MNRLEERKIVFEIVFSALFNDDKPIEDVIELYKESKDIQDISEYVNSTVFGIHNNIQSIDDRIKATIVGRKFDRLDNICLTALRYAVYEIFYNDSIPDNVAINEAIELTKKYDDTLCSYVHANLAIIIKNK